MNSRFNVAQYKYRATLPIDGDVAEQPCNLNGGSPLLHIACSRITDLLFTGRAVAYYSRFVSAPEVQSDYSRHCPRRVEQFSPMNTTKETSPRTVKPAFYRPKKYIPVIFPPNATFKQQRRLPVKLRSLFNNSSGCRLKNQVIHDLRIAFPITIPGGLS